MNDRSYYVTTPLYYANDELHIGHATTTVYADALARFKRLDGYNVVFLTGSDEHGQKIFRAAQAAGVTPKVFVDGIVGKFRDLWKLLDISEHIFIRTTDAYHERVVRALFRKLKERGYIYKGAYRALYCVACETAYSLSSLVDGKCPIHHTPPTELTEENYFFRLSAFADTLRTRLGDDTLDPSARVAGVRAEPECIVPGNRRNEVLGKLREGIEDASVSRTAFDWGVRMPDDEAHVIWVWFDALINYVSALLVREVQASGETEPDFDRLLQSQTFQTFWPSVHHLIGKEILWHHSVVWWSMLHGAGVAMPHRVLVHGWWTVEGQKMGKSLGNVLNPVTLVQHYGLDTFRYFLLREGPQRADADWRQQRFIQVHNGELASDLGNLLSRVLGMLEKYFVAVVPAPETPVAGTSELETMAKGLVEALRARMDAMDFSGAIEEIWKLVRRANKYIDDTAPFRLAKDPARRGELATVMHGLLQTLRVLCGVLEPFIPGTCAAMREQLGLSGSRALTLEVACAWDSGLIGVTTRKGPGLFPKIEENA